MLQNTLYKNNFSITLFHVQGCLGLEPISQHALRERQLLESTEHRWNMLTTYRKVHRNTKKTRKFRGQVKVKPPAAFFLFYFLVPQLINIIPLCFHWMSTHPHTALTHHPSH